ncbi:MAG TPA: hypothetical protein VMF56_04075 [Acidobacteriaceae bacterium]|nr:hypothetical protein [Acidobacteriaceae bacterium]
MKLIRNVLFALTAFTALGGSVIPAYAAATKTTTKASSTHHHKHQHKK